MPKLTLLVGVAALASAGCQRAVITSAPEQEAVAAAPGPEGDTIKRLVEHGPDNLNDCAFERSSLHYEAHPTWPLSIGEKRVIVKTEFHNSPGNIARWVSAGQPPYGPWENVWQAPDPPASWLLWVDAVAGGAQAFIVVGYHNRLDVLAVAPLTEGVSATEPIAIHTPADDVMGVRLQRSAKRMHVAWLEEGTSGWPYDARLYYASGTLDGHEWSNPRCISETGVIGSFNLIADGDDVFIAWSDTRFRSGDLDWPVNEAKAFFIRSTDEGANFGRPIMLNEPTKRNDNAALLYVAPAKQGLMVFWASQRNGLEGNPWQYGLLDRNLTLLRDWGPIAGKAIAEAYAKRVVQQLAAGAGRE